MELLFPHAAVDYLNDLYVVTKSTQLQKYGLVLETMYGKRFSVP